MQAVHFWEESFEGLFWEPSFRYLSLIAALLQLIPVHFLEPTKIRELVLCFSGKDKCEVLLAK